jgi:hypothetical protein
VALEIHVLMKNSDHVDSIMDDAKEQHVRACRIFTVPGAEMITGTASTWIARYRFDRVSYVEDIASRMSRM